MIIPHEFTIQVKPATLMENSLPVLMWSFYYRGQVHGNALKLPTSVFENKDSFELAMSLLVENLMESYEAVVRKGTGEDANS